MKTLLLIATVVLSSISYAPDYTQLVDDELEAMWADSNKHLSPTEVLVASYSRLQGVYPKLDYKTQEAIRENWNRFYKSEVPKYVKRMNADSMCFYDLDMAAKLRTTHPMEFSAALGGVLFNNRHLFLDSMTIKPLAFQLDVDLHYAYVMPPTGAASRYQSAVGKEDGIRVLTDFLTQYSKDPKYSGKKDIAVKLSGVTPDEELKIYGRLLSDPLVAPGAENVLRGLAVDVLRTNPELAKEYRSKGGFFNTAKAVLNKDQDAWCNFAVGRLAKKLK